MRGLCLVDSLSSQQLVESVLTPVILDSKAQKKQLALLFNAFMKRLDVNISEALFTMTECPDHGRQLTPTMSRL